MGWKWNRNTSGLTDWIQISRDQRKYTKIWLTYSQFKFPSHLTDSFIHIQFLSIISSGSTMCEKEKTNRRHMLYVIYPWTYKICVLCENVTILYTFGGRSSLEYTYLLCQKKIIINIPSSTNYNEIQIRRKSWTTSYGKTCGLKVIVYVPNEQLNQGYAKIVHCNSIKKMNFCRRLVQYTITVRMWFEWLGDLPLYEVPVIN